MAKNIEVGKFYFHVSNLIMHVSGVDVTEFDPYESGRVYVSGSKLDLDKKEVRFGDEISASYLTGGPLTEAQKERIVAEFARAGKKEIAERFFGEGSLGAHPCGICGASYPDVGSLYQHQMAVHDPDNIMFSEIGLPK